MKNNISLKEMLPILFVFLCAIIAGTLAIRYNISQNQPSNRAILPVEEETPKDPPLTRSGTILSLRDIKDPYRCVFKQEKDSVITSGTVYVRDGNLRTNLRTQVEDVTSDINSVISGNDFYLWTPEHKQGMKASLASFLETNKTSNEPTQQPSSGLLNSYDFTCSKWTAVTNMFEIPSSVNFVDLSAALNQIKDSPCVLCDNALDETKREQCKQTYKCE